MPSGLGSSLQTSTFYYEGIPLLFLLCSDPSFVPRKYWVIFRDFLRGRFQLRTDVVKVILLSWGTTCSMLSGARTEMWWLCTGRALRVRYELDFFFPTFHPWWEITWSFPVTEAFVEIKQGRWRWRLSIHSGISASPLPSDVVVSQDSSYSTV